MLLKFCTGRDNLWTAGFGHTDPFNTSSSSDILMHVSSKYISLEQCADIYADSHVFVTEKVICIQNDDDTKLACYGEFDVSLIISHRHD